MKQVLVRKGTVFVDDVPSPLVSQGAVLIQTVSSCISAGTELSGVSYSGKNVIQKALAQPEKIQKVLNIARDEGIFRVVRKIQEKQNEVTPTGYSAAGIIVAVGPGVDEFHVGDRVAAAGAGIANHAEYIDVPVNLVMRIPDELDFQRASTVTLGGIAMQGVRRADLRMGELAVVIGAGILGLLSIQMLRLSGVRVAAVDLDQRRLAIAKSLGAEMVFNPSEGDVVDSVVCWSGGVGADAVLFTAATSSSEPLAQSFQMCRKKGRVVLVGVVGMQINREDMYAKELDFLISTSYGPGRYDTTYEQKGLDYPYAYVRWTENRNMTEYLRLLETEAIDLNPLIEKTYPIEKATEAFASLTQEGSRPLMVILDYPEAEGTRQNIWYIASESNTTDKSILQVALVGAGGFAEGMHLPILKKMSKQFRLRSVMSHTGSKTKAIAEKYKVDYCTVDYQKILEDSDIDLVLICTRHDSHFPLTLKALEAGKNVFVEKPLVTTEEELRKIEGFYDSGKTDDPLLFVGYNRRFSSYAREIKKHTESRVNPVLIHYRMNAGYIPYDHWVHDSGGRIVGEACHLIDLFSYIVGMAPKAISVVPMAFQEGQYKGCDNRQVIIEYMDGSVASLQYFSIGNRKLTKEYMEVHFDGKSICVDNFQNIDGYGVTLKSIRHPSPSKGHEEEWQALYKSLTKPGSDWPISLESMLETSKLSFLAK